MSGDDEERVDAAVAAAVGIELEARLANGTGRRDERRDEVADEAEVGRNAEERVRGGAGAAHVGLGVTARTRDEVEARAHALGHRLFFGEIVAADGEHLLLVGGQPADDLAGIDAGPHAGIARAELRVDRLRDAQRGDDDDADDRDDDSCGRLAHGRLRSVTTVPDGRRERRDDGCPGGKGDARPACDVMAE